MDMMADMMQSMKMTDMPMTMDMAMTQEAIEACSAAAMAATMCADADTGDELSRCGGMCANTNDVATTMMRMLMRPSGYDMAVMQSMMTACITMGAACAVECHMHEEMHEHCRICAMACEAMVDSLKRMMSSMSMAKG
jgi:hypothetical protein